MRILLISDTSGNSDEGMKNIARSLTTELNLINGISADNKRSIFSCLKYDIIHFIGGPGIGTLINALLCKILLRKVIITFSNPFIDSYGLFFLRALKPDLSITMSKSWQCLLVKNQINTLFFNLSGTKTKFFNNTHRVNKNKLRKRLNLPTNKTIVMHAGHLKRDRNLKMFELLDDTVFKLLIVSKTTKKELDLKNELKQIKNLKIIEEYLPNIYDYYNASDIYFFPTVDEKAAIQIPLSIIEAYSCGIKILTTRFGGLELLFPPQNNEGVVYTNFKDISDKLDHIKKLKFKRNIEKFNFSNISKDLVSIYKKVLDK